MVLQCLMPRMVKVFLDGQEMLIILNYLHLMHARVIHVIKFLQKLIIYLFLNNIENSGVYHHHILPVCLFNYTDSTKHSPIVGFAFDGFPVYGPFGNI